VPRRPARDIEQSRPKTALTRPYSFFGSISSSRLVGPGTFEHLPKRIRKARTLTATALSRGEELRVNVLVFVTSRYGATRGIAETMAETLERRAARRITPGATGFLRKRSRRGRVGDDCLGRTRARSQVDTETAALRPVSSRLAALARRARASPDPVVEPGGTRRRSGPALAPGALMLG
jgi:hypothetical protein